MNYSNFSHSLNRNLINKIFLEFNEDIRNDIEDNSPGFKITVLKEEMSDISDKFLDHHDFIQDNTSNMNVNKSRPTLGSRKLKVRRKSEFKKTSSQTEIAKKIYLAKRIDRKDSKFCFNQPISKISILNLS